MVLKACTYTVTRPLKSESQLSFQDDCSFFLAAARPALEFRYLLLQEVERQSARGKSHLSSLLVTSKEAHIPFLRPFHAIICDEERRRPVQDLGSESPPSIENHRTGTGKGVLAVGTKAIGNDASLLRRNTYPSIHC